MKYLVVSIHDASPAYFDELQDITRWLDQNAIAPRCIKVIPDYLGQWNILEHGKFLDWLLAEKGKGSEVIQHGFVHFDRKRPKGILSRLQDRLFTRQQAEFIRTDYQETREAVESGSQILHRAGIEFCGFTSPTWHQSREASRAIQDCGFRYYTSLSSVFDCHRERHIFSLAMGFQGVSSPLEYMAMGGNMVMSRTGLFCSPLARIVLHPYGIDNSRPFVHVLKDILQLARKRKLVTYNQYLGLTSND